MGKCDLSCGQMQPVMWANGICHVGKCNLSCGQMRPLMWANATLMEANATSYVGNVPWILTLTVIKRL